MDTRARNSSNSWRSEAVSMERAVEPSIGMSALSRDWERLIAVCPPNCTIAAGKTISFSSVTMASFSRMSRTLSSSSGSKYRRSLVSKSVETVSGLELTMMLSMPSSLSAQAAWTEQ